MAIEKNYVKVASLSRFDSEISVGCRSRESMLSDDDELRRRNSVDSQDDDDDDGYDDADSGAGSDDFDLLELGETHSEFCQVGDQTCCVPFELYDLPDLHGILSLDVWNQCLTDDERFSLAKYLPDLDQEMFMRTLKDLLEGSNFHFGTPVTRLFQMLKGGLCEPRVCLYLQGMRFFQSHKHYHLLRKHQDFMVASFLQMREAWQNCKGYGIEEKLRVFNIMKSQKSLMGVRNEDVRSDSSGMKETDEALWGMKSKGRATWKKASDLNSLYDVNPALDVLSQGRPVATDLAAKHSKKNSKGSLKMGGSRTPSLDEMAPSHQHRYRSVKYDPYDADLVPPRGGKTNTYDAMTAHQMREQMAGSDLEREMIYGIGSQREWNVVHCNTIHQGRSPNTGNKYEVSRGGEYDGRSYTSFPFSANNDVPDRKRNPNINQLSDIKVLTSKPSNIRAVYGPAKEKYLDPAYVDQMKKATKARTKGVVLKGNLSDFPNVDESYRSKDREGKAYFAEPSSFNGEDRDASKRKLKLRREFPDTRFKSVGEMDDRIYRPKKQAKVLLQHVKGGSLVQNRGLSMVPANNGGKLSGGCYGDETESESSDEHEDEDEDDLPLIMTKLGARAHFQNYNAPSTSAIHHQNEKIAKRNTPTVKEMSSTMSNSGSYVPMRGTDAYSSKSKMRHPNIIHNNTFSAGSENGQYSVYGNTYIKNNQKSTRNVQLQAELAEKYSMSSMNIEGNVGLFSTGLVETDCKEYQQEPYESSQLRKQNKRRRAAAESCSLDAGSEEVPVSEFAVAVADVELEAKPQKKPFVLITPTVHTDFPFSVIHLLSAVRMALIAPIKGEDSSSEAGKQCGTSDAKEEDGNGNGNGNGNGKQSVKEEDVNGNGKQCGGTCDVKEENENENYESTNGSIKEADVKDGPLDKTTTPSLTPPDKTTSPSFTVQEIVNHVRSNPGDPSILETREPLLDLVRGAMKILSSRIAPLEAKDWKPLVCYEKVSKSWTWTGPAPLKNSTDFGTPEEEVLSPEAWGIPHEMLAKLVDSFANWLKRSQETLRLIESLPAPPAELMQLTFDEKERFKDLRAQKSLSTIPTSSEQVRAYFQKEEQLRYSIPDRAFSYTAADGKKSIVAPLRRFGEKPTSKGRDHAIFKQDRPPHVTILCLVRDAAARLPGGIGTRADVCTLIRDSQFIVDDVPDEKVVKVVSGALDRLHYERDPCVQYVSERKLWVYLHRDREEDDFEDNGTSSTKRWKRPKKEASQPDDHQVTVACHANVEEPSGPATATATDIHVESSFAQNDQLVEVGCDGTKQTTEDDDKASDMHDGDFQQLIENELQCQ